MSGHNQLLARLDLLISEASDLCDRAEAVDDARTGALGPEAMIPFAFRTVLHRRVLDWMHRSESVVREVKSAGDTICGERASELRGLIDTANVATMKRSDSGDSWNAFYRSTRRIQFSA